MSTKTSGNLKILWGELPTSTRNHHLVVIFCLRMCFWSQCRPPPRPAPLLRPAPPPRPPPPNPPPLGWLGLELRDGAEWLMLLPPKPPPREPLCELPPGRELPMPELRGASCRGAGEEGGIWCTGGGAGVCRGGGDGGIGGIGRIGGIGGMGGIDGMGGGGGGTGRGGGGGIW